MVTTFAIDIPPYPWQWRSLRFPGKSFDDNKDMDSRRTQIGKRMERYRFCEMHVDNVYSLTIPIFRPHERSPSKLRIQTNVVWNPILNEQFVLANLEDDYLCHQELELQGHKRH
jgi:hypothetical protein